jgi:hypothetical protein
MFKPFKLLISLSNYYFSFSPGKQKEDDDSGKKATD